MLLLAWVIANPMTSISHLSGALLIVVLAGLLFTEELGVPVPFAPGDLLLLIAGIAIASDTVDPVAMLISLLLAISVGALLGREVFAAVGRPTLMKIAEALRFGPALERATRLLRRGGAPAVFVARLIPGLRIHTTQVAGVSNMPRLTFAAGLIPSVVVYIGVFVGLGALVGQPVVKFFNRAEHRFFVIGVTTLATLAVVLSVRWLARRGALAMLEPIIVVVRRDLADAVEERLLAGREDRAERKAYPLVRRLWAGAIDVLVVVALTVLILTAVSGLDTTELILDPEGILLLAAVALGYRIPYESLSGQSIGKDVMGICVTRSNGRPPGLWRAALRNLVSVLFVLWPIDAALIITSHHRQRLGDRLTDTTVRELVR